uniref:Uncharacterized protein n=1 Tax=Clastoptera arizonana TaxID=38151 RepID=A0A1B6DS86_9HEMI
MTESKSGSVCGVCCRPICDRYIMRVVDQSYHERCLLCCICGSRLAHTCFTRDSKLYCRLDYDRLYVKKCLGCSERIGPDELVMRAIDSVFHLRCFICVVCGVRLQKGDQFIIKQGQLFCRPDYEKEVEMLQGYNPGEYTCDDLLTTSRSQDGRRGPKRPRTILTTQQRRAFKASFEISPKPCRKVREGLAKDTGLSVRIVQVWFQNQRAKMKKIQKKARLDTKNNNKDMDCDEKSDKMKLKEEEHSPLGGNSFLNDSCSDTDTVMGGMGSDRERDHFLHIKEEMEHEEAAFYKSMLTEHQRELLTAGSAIHSGKLDSSFMAFQAYHPDGGPVDGTPLFPASSLGLNPIDRLYSMQTSYFCGEDPITT